MKNGGYGSKVKNGGTTAGNISAEGEGPGGLGKNQIASR